MPISETGPAASATLLRARLRYAAIVLDIPEEQVAPFIAMPDAELVHADGLIDLSEEHGLSLDWLLFDDLEPMMRSLAARRTAHKRDPAVAAYREWLDAVHALKTVYDSHEDGPADDDPELLRVQAVEDAALKALAKAPVTTPEGAAGKLHLLLVLHQCHHWRAGDDPETFEAWECGFDLDKNCALTMWRGHLQMGAQA
ncbi:MAG TPA: hypothetical protein VMM55_04105 [Thermohalobaculum sp.]|nr:hypothetical protein [Thermohalobaculum sp.]